MKRVSVEFYDIAITDLVYDESSPSCLRWRKTGEPAGCQDSNKYWLVRVGGRIGKLLRAHRIVWYIQHGQLPDLLDHRDTDPANNRIVNLRVATESQNRHNANRHVDNTSGYKGVYWDKRTGKWVVKVSLNYESHWGGRFTDKQEAIEVAKDLRNKLHREFAKQ